MSSTQVASCKLHDAYLCQGGHATWPNEKVQFDYMRANAQPEKTTVHIGKALRRHGHMLRLADCDIHGCSVRAGVCLAYRELCTAISMHAGMVDYNKCYHHLHRDANN